MNELIKKLQQQKQIIESQGYSVAYICIYGSQNYDLQIHNEQYQSDIDMKAIVVPTLDELIKDSKPVSTVVNTEWGQCDLKDIRSYFKTLTKANPAYVETLYTDYYIVDEKFSNEFNQIFKLKDQLVEALSAQMIRAMYGMMCEKQKALCHPYPTIAHKIERYGYDGKQSHHIFRLWYMMQDYFQNNKDLKSCMYPGDDRIGKLMKHKLNKPSLNETKCDVEKTMVQAKEFKDEVLGSIDEGKIDYSIKNKFIELSQAIIKNKIINEYKDGGKE